MDSAAKLGPVVMTPHKGLMSLGQRLAHRCGLDGIWDGEDGLGAILSESLKDAGVPEEIKMTPRAIAEKSGLVRKKRKTKVRK